MVKKICLKCETWVRSLGQEDTLENRMATHPVFLPGKMQGEDGKGKWASLAGTLTSNSTTMWSPCVPDPLQTGRAR